MSESDSINAPLARRQARLERMRQRPGKRGPVPVARLAFLGIGTLLAIVAGRILLVDTPDGGQPYAEVAINSTHNANPIVGANANLPAEIVAVGPELTPEQLDSVLAAGAEGAPAVAAESLPSEYAMLPELAEDTEYGILPRRSPAGQTPFAAYARASITPATAGGRPMIAIVVTGLGINLAGTLSAIEKLPETVTLAFAPYGRDLSRTVGAARAEGHEIFLEVPLEPFDYPENDPGPDTLLTGQAPRDNMQKLYRVMGKFGGYAGLINNMGARFTASGADFGPMMEELGARGLGYLDDGSSNRSLAQQLAAANRVPFATASMVLDNNPARAPILERLAELEEQARRTGSAIGLIAALPVSVETIAAWSAEVESRGFVVVPASALMQN